MTKAKTFTQEIEMGATVRDVLTGFEGVVAGYARHITGCDTIGVRPAKLGNDGKVMDPEWFDVTRAEILAPPTKEIALVVAGKMQKGKKKTKLKGGPQDTPSTDRG